MSPPRRRALRCSAALAAVVAAFAAGAVTGAASRPVSAAGTPGVLDEAARQIGQSTISPVNVAQLQRAAVAGMLGALHDPWSAYYSPRDADKVEDAVSGSYSGVGLWVRDDNGPVVVSSVRPGSPAAAAGTRAGDIVTSVDGRPPGADGGPRVVAALRGTPGTVATVAIRRGGAVQTLRLRRERMVPDDVAARMVAPAVGCVQVATFSRGSGGRVHAALDRLRAHGARGVLLDLRGDPGGLLSEAVDTASVFLAGGPVVSYAGKDGLSHRLDAALSGDPAIPLVVLVDGGTASAAEVVAGALQDRGRAVLVGTRTFGKGSVQEPMALPDGSEVELTVARYRTPTGRSLDGVGLDPDVVVPTSESPAAALQRGIDVLVGLAADADGAADSTPLGAG